MTVPAYSITISPASMSLRQNRPSPWMQDWYTPTICLYVFWRTRYLMAIGRSEAVGILREWGVLLCKTILSLYVVWPYNQYNYITIILMILRSINFKKDVVSYVSVRRPSSVNCTTKMVTSIVSHAKTVSTFIQVKLVEHYIKGFQSTNMPSNVRIRTTVYLYMCGQLIMIADYF